jgi:putative ABC transport system permease protein
MLKHNLVTSFRSIKRNLSFSIINISGLSIGLTLIIILFVWLQFEFSFDKFHENADRIFRVVVEFEREKSPDNFAGTPAPLGEAMKMDIPEVIDYVRFGNLGRVLVNYENEQFWEEIELADPSIFKIFSFKLLKGNPGTALNNLGSVILSETKARKYFGSRDPLGQTLLIGEGDKKTPYIITGVMKDIPANSQIQFDFLSSFSEDRSDKSWGMKNYSTYILAKYEGAFKTLSKKLPGVVNKIPDEDKFQLHVQPLLKIHLHSKLRDDLSTNTNIKTVYIISSILILVLIVACINYMNLATARYTKRGKEAGLRKVAGATNSNLIGQFLCESFAVTFSAFIIALFLFYLLLPVIIALTGIPLNTESLFTLDSFVKFILLIILITFIAGSYPALMLSSVSPVSALHDDLKLARIISVKGLRKGLVIFQFFISIALVASAIVIKAQLALIKNKNLGLTSDQVVVVPIYQAQVKPKYELFKREILTNPAILNASAVAYYPGTQGYFQNTWWEGLTEGDLSHYMDWLPVDQDFISTLKIDLLKGEFFPKDISSKSPIVYVLNELAVKKIGWDDPIGKQFDIIGKGVVVGVVKDFNFKSLHNELKQVALTYYPEQFDNLMIKITTENIPKTLDFLKEKWESLFPQYPFEFTFLSDDFQKMYKKETTTSLIITYISLMALFVSCIGLFGLVLFTIDSRIKEIGLRKVAGSTTGRIVLMLNLEFIKWILVSFIIACPIIIYSMHKWLENFAYRINLSWWIFAFAVLITIIISLLTVSWHTWSTATKNPVDCLKHE